MGPQRNHVDQRWMPTVASGRPRVVDFFQISVENNRARWRVVSRD